MKVNILIALLAGACSIAWTAKEDPWARTTEGQERERQRLQLVNSVLDRVEGSKSVREPEDVYQEAMLLFRQGKYSQAQDVFAELAHLSPGYKNSESIVRLVEQRVKND